jgi:hypothetical protein
LQSFHLTDADRGVAIGRIAGIEHDETRVVDPAIGIFEGARRDALFARLACDIEIAKRDAARVTRKNEAQRVHDVRRQSPQTLALDRRLADETKLEIFEMAQAAMNEFRRRRRRLRPCRAASRAMPQPLMPKPMIARSQLSYNWRAARYPRESMTRSERMTEIRSTERGLQ